MSTYRYTKTIGEAEAMQTWSIPRGESTEEGTFKVYKIIACVSGGQNAVIVLNI